jgi:iron complex outermembrane receptor protein
MSAYKWDFFMGINNILDTEYTSFVQINAPGARYFNPAAGINLYAGMRIGLPFGIK